MHRDYYFSVTVALKGALKCISILPDEDIRTLATNISNMLAKNQSLLTDTEEDDTYGEVL